MILIPTVFALGYFYRGAAVVLIVALLAGSAGLAIREVAISHNLVYQAARSAGQVEIIATVRSDPVESAVKVVGSHLRAGQYSVKARTEQITVGKISSHARTPIRIFSRRSFPVILGERISCTGKLFASSDRKYSAYFSLTQPCRLVVAASRLDKWSADIRANFRRSATKISGAGGSLIPGLVIGDTSLEGQDFQSNMRRCGLSHLTAVSGANFAIIAEFLLWFLQWFLPNKRARILLTAVVLAGFIVLVRPSPSVLRACIMTATILFSKAHGQRASSIPSLGLAISVLLLMDPLQATDPGFALSVAATSGIILMSPRINEKLRPYLGFATEMVAIPLSATLFCMPIIIGISGQFSLVTLPANIAVGLVVAPITVVGLAAALLAGFLPSITHLCLILISPGSAWIAWVAKFGAQLPLLLFPKNIFGIVLVIIFFLSIVRRRKIISFGLGLVIVGFVVLPFTPWPGPDWIFVSCDVGQGDGSVINLGNHQGIVIDTGPDPAKINVCLNRLGIMDIPLLVLTHFHADHVFGLTGVLHNRHVQRVWISNLPEPATDYSVTMATLKSLPVSVVHSGQTFTFNNSNATSTDVRIHVLWPPVTTRKMATVPGDGSTVNNASVALLIQVGEVTVFAAGDIEPPAQEVISQELGLHSVDILKVAHHGSTYQYLPLLDLLAPKIALISVGTGNPYGHPALNTLAALTVRGVAIYRTDRDGSIAVTSSHKIRTIKKDWWRISWG